jgi:hypothetical protein
MSKRCWYILVPDGTLGSSRDSKGFVELSGDEVVFSLKNAVREGNMVRLGHHDAMVLKVFENGSEVLLDPTKPLTDCTSGQPEKPFIIHYPGSTIIHLGFCS